MLSKIQQLLRFGWAAFPIAVVAFPRVLLGTPLGILLCILYSIDVIISLWKSHPKNEKE